jgi:hypothetical protein
MYRGYALRRFWFAPSLFLFLALSTIVQCQPTPAPTGWSAVERLKKDSMVVVDRVLAPGEYEERLPCRVVQVDADSLVCAPQGARGTRIVHPAGQVAAVYLCKTHLSPNFVKMILFGGAGWAFGGIITDDRWNYPLATIDAIGGVLYGLVSNKPREKLVLIYQRAPGESVSPAVSP